MEYWVESETIAHELLWDLTMSAEYFSSSGLCLLM